MISNSSKSNLLVINLLLCLVLLFTFHGSVLAKANNTKDIGHNLERVQKALDELNKKYDGISITIDPSKVTREDLKQYDGYSDKELVEYLRSFFEESKKTTQVALKSEQVSNDSRTDFRVSSSSNTTYPNRIASVHLAVPAIGTCRLEIRFTSVLDSNLYFVSGEVHNSKDIGTCIGSWSHDYGTFEVAYYRTYATITAHGVLSYGIQGTPFHNSSRHSVQYLDRWVNY